MIAKYQAWRRSRERERRFMSAIKCLGQDGKLALHAVRLRIAFGMDVEEAYKRVEVECINRMQVRMNFR